MEMLNTACVSAIKLFKQSVSSPHGLHWSSRTSALLHLPLRYLFLYRSVPWNGVLKQDKGMCLRIWGHRAASRMPNKEFILAAGPARYGQLPGSEKAADPPRT